VKLGLLLGLLGALGPLAIDLYLPAFPTLAQEFGAPPAAVQLSLVSFFLALALGPLAYGALADRYGRRPPLFGGLALFMLASIGCATAPDIHSLIALRFLQGLGASAGTTIARSIIRDLHSGAAAARLMATMYLVLGVSPVLAPLAGSLLLQVIGWRGLFLIIAGLVAASALLVAVTLPETHPPAKRAVGSRRSPLADFRHLIADRRYLQLVFVAAGATASAFVFVTGAPFVFAQHYALAPTQFSALIGVNAAGQILSTQFAPLLMRRLGAARLLHAVTLTVTVAGSMLLALILSGGAPLALLVLLCLVVACCVGLWLTPAAVTVLDEHPELAGSAAGLLSTVQLASAAAIAALTSMLERGDGLGIAGGYLLCGGVALLLCRRAFTRRPS
jgi:MFS transporter, DHA1 family, multidrug resistance protein